MKFAALGVNCERYLLRPFMCLFSYIVRDQAAK